MTWFTRLRFINRNGPAGKLLALESRNGSFGRLAIRHFHKAKATRTPSFTVGNDVDLFHNTILLEELAEVLISSRVRKVSNKNIHKLSLLGNVATVARISEQYARAIQRRNGEA
jgi:hypothetical protein